MMHKGNYGSGRYDGMETNGGCGSESSTAKRYQDKASGTGGYGHGAIPDSNPSQKGDFPSSLPNESPEAMVSESAKAGARVGNAKL